jgi:Omp85 superfamily domain
MLPIRSVPGVCEARLFTGAACDPKAPPALLLEVPHGADRARQFEALAARLEGPLPEGLIEFFHVNTDAGARPYAEALARRFVEEEPRRSALVLSSEIPRTLIDCNRRIDASPEEFKAGRVTPGLPPYVRSPKDRAQLLSLHARWVELLQAAYEQVCGQGGLGLMAHTYAPRSVDVEVDERIVESLRRAYAPEVEPTWPLRPQIDLIARDDQGVLRGAPLVERLERAFTEDGFEVKVSATYPLHPSTLGHQAALRYEPRVACVEVRRDLLVKEFRPLRQLEPDPAKVARVAAPLCRALRGALIPALLLAVGLGTPAFAADGAQSEDDAPAAPESTLAAPQRPYEDSLVARALAATQLTVEPAPAGKVLERVEIFREDVIAEADPYPLWFAAVHAKSTDQLVRQELLVSPGEVWDQRRVEETARNLRSLFVLAVVQAVACKGEGGGVVLLIATKDLWSLRLNSAVTEVGSVVQVLDLQPTEQNLFGLGKAASLHLRFQQLDLGDFALRDKAAIGLAYTDPRLFGSRWSLQPALDVLVAGAIPCAGRTAAGGQWCPNAKPGQLDGLAGSVDLQRPLFSLATEWAFDLNGSINRRQYRRYLSGNGVHIASVTFDPASVPAAQQVVLPVVYNIEEYAGQAQVTRSSGSDWKLDLSAGAGAFRHLYTAPGNFDYDPSLLAQYVAAVLPRSEDDAYLFASARSHDTRYVTLRNLQAFALTEDYLLGHDVSVTLQAADNLQAFSQSFVAASAKASYRLYRGDDLLTLSTSLQTRWQPNLSELGHDGPLANTVFQASVRNASPVFLHGRLHAQATLLLRRNDINQSLVSLGGDSGLRGYVTNAFLGSEVLAANLEYRSEPWDLWSLHSGFVLFYDGGGVFGGDDPAQPSQPLVFAWRQSVGAGLRLQFPQFDKAPIRIDFAWPIAAPAGTQSWFTFAYGQAF